ncbi:unnamed protein product [Fraxinus pennsylvanica]|uniref:Legume lectin domain-containing protein n=1 Tax=Fraxinus pennsylvanica TaxID=56036 RepID=A0AAD2DSQ0_9LAMI|nr:unnamed protein product [Fraxinus pennsylvanica]
MASNLVSRYFMAFLLLNLYLKVVGADLNLSFSFENFGRYSEEFESQIALYGDARVANDSIRISGSGRVIYKNPVKFVEENQKNMVSSMNFVFSMSSENGDGLAFIIVLASFPVDFFDGGSMGLLKERKMRFLAIEFDTFKDEKYGDANGNHVGIDIDSLVSVKAWIDYEANSKRIEVRLSKLGIVKPVEPLLSYPIDLSQMWGKEDALVGLSSSSGNSSKKRPVVSEEYAVKPKEYALQPKEFEYKKFNVAVDKTMDDGK